MKVFLLYDCDVRVYDSTAFVICYGYSWEIRCWLLWVLVDGIVIAAAVLLFSIAVSLVEVIVSLL